jgi:hypothetical protein
VTPDTTAGLECEFYPLMDDHGTAIVHGVIISSEGSLPPALHVGLGCSVRPRPAYSAQPTGGVRAKL